MARNSRRDFLRNAFTFAPGAALASQFLAQRAHAAPGGSNMKFGLVTYQWGKDWDLPTLIANCEKTGAHGVELRIEHAHNVTPDMSAAAREEVKKRFADSPVTCLGMGTNQDYHHPDPDKLAESIQGTKAYLRLSHDIGGSGVKVKPNTLPEGVPVEQTIEQIGKSLNTVGEYAANLGQQIRVEVHGRKTSELPIMKRIFDVADNPNVTVCWNSNDTDLEGEGLEHNFNLVKDRFGDTVHIRELNVGDYPYQKLMNLFVQMDYAGWILLEARTNPDDRVAALKEQVDLFHQMVKEAQA
jgi:sugar phosphate isomerase/epimerase